MSYHVTILRTQDGQQKPISPAEVETAVASMLDLGIRRGMHGNLEISSSAQEGKQGVLFWKNGEIWTKNPDRETLRMMLGLAGKLNARVRGDEFETYRTPEETYEHPDDLAAIQASQQEVRQIIRTTKFKQWLVYSAILVGFILLGLLVSLVS